jgi:signal recognition particle receptor subunit beta
MSIINVFAKEISVKIVYYGPGLGGKTTNIKFIHEKLPEELKTKMVSLNTEEDRTLFFDYFPLDLGFIRGFKTRFQLYTVPGQVTYIATRRLVLRGVDGVVFVADSQDDMQEENIDSFQDMSENLYSYGHDLASLPIVMQYNKRDVENAVPIETLNSTLNKNDFPYTPAIATQGAGVIKTLRMIGRDVMDHLNRKYSPYE